MTSVVDVRYRTESPEDSSRHAGLSHLAWSFLHVAANAGVSPVILLNDSLCFRSRKTSSLRQSKRTDYVRDCEVDDLCEPSRVRLLLLCRRSKHFPRRAGVNIFSALESFGHNRIAGHVRKYSKLDLRVVSRHQLVSRRSNECSADPAAQFRSDRDVLQIGIRR